MDEMKNNESRPVNPRRRRRSQAEIFKESYLPVIIGAVALIMILVFIIGSISRAIQQGNQAKQDAINASIAAAEEAQRLAEEVEDLLKISANFAANYDYKNAITVIDTFTGDITKYPQLIDRRTQYEDAEKNLIAWNDPSQIVNLSFQLLIADPTRAFVDRSYGTAYNRNFVTIDEFSEILNQLYANDYILVSLDDFITTETTEDETTVYAIKTLYLPAGKKPLVLTQTHVNYNTFMIDGDGDKLPDKNGAGFASKLILDANGKLINEMVDREGNTVTGAYDLVPILNAFLEKHPDFSYKGAKAIIAVTGYDGLFGYRTNPGAKDRLGEDAYQQEIDNAKKIADALRKDGFDIACYTYENVPYGSYSLTRLKTDLNKWINEVVPILGDVDIFAFAQLSDIASNGTYSGDKFNTLYDAGFRYFLGFCNDGELWASVANDYVRQARILVTGSNMKYHADWFADLFDPSTVLDSIRGNIPK